MRASKIMQIIKWLFIVIFCFLIASQYGYNNWQFWVLLLVGSLMVAFAELHGEYREEERIRDANEAKSENHSQEQQRVDGGTCLSSLPARGATPDVKEAKAEPEVKG